MVQPDAEGDSSESSGRERVDENPASQNTGRTLVESVATVTVDDTPAENPRVVIHVEHPDHDGGVRAFWRRRDSDIAASIRSHLQTELATDPTRIEVIDKAGVGISESGVLPRRLSQSRSFEEPTTVEVSTA